MVLGNDINDIGWNSRGPGHANPFVYMTDHHPDTFLRANLIMNIKTLLVLDEILRMKRFPNIVIKTCHSQKNGVQANGLGGSLRQSAHGHTVVVSPGRLDNHIPNDRQVEVTQFQKAKVGSHHEKTFA